MTVEEIIYLKLLQDNNDLASDSFLQLGSEQKRQNAAESIDSADCHLNEIDRYIAAMDKNKENYAFREIYSCQKWIGPIIVFHKRIIRKLLKWYIEPICFQQTEFNNAVTLAGDKVELLVSLVCQKAEQLELKTEQLEKEIEHLKKSNAELERELKVARSYNREKKKL